MVKWHLWYTFQQYVYHVFSPWLPPSKTSCCVQLLSFVWTCDPMDCTTPGFLFFTISWSLLRLVSSDAIQLSYPLLPPSPPALSLSNVFWTLESGSFPMSQLFTSGGQSIPLKWSVVIPMKWKSLSRIRLFVTLWTVVHGILQARILEWVAVLFSRGSSQSRDWTQVSHIAGRFFTSWATREAQELEWVAYPFSGGFSWPRNWIGVFCIAGRFFTNWAICVL